MQQFGGQEKEYCIRNRCEHMYHGSSNTFVAKWNSKVSYGYLHHGCGHHSQKIVDGSESDWKLCLGGWNFELTCGTSYLAFGLTSAVHEF